jgi:Reverse transcriptase (RNA-dependent DNA polymerase)
VLFLAEFNNDLQLWATDIGNAYLEAYTTEKVYIIAGPEFGEREGHILVISKALYGLNSSGARWHDRFADCIRELGFFPCKAEPDILMRKNGNIYKYIAVYVDGLANRTNSLTF